MGRSLSLALAACLALLASCKPGSKEVILATTTSTQDTGLLDVLVPMFEKQSGYALKTISVGSGQAMAMGRRGEADVLLVHSPDDEEAFMKEGFGSRRLAVMHNDFVIVCPPAASLRGAASAVEAFKAIAAKQILFVSRSDDSGTHVREKKIWKQASIEPAGDWYVETGLGMGRTLSVASEKEGCTLSDRGTFLALGKGLDLEIAVKGDPTLLNAYHVIEVDGGKFPDVNHRGARAFADFLVSAGTQQAIGSFGVDRFGEPLFVPDAPGK